MTTTKLYLLGGPLDGALARSSAEPVERMAYAIGARLAFYTLSLAGKYNFTGYGPRRDAKAAGRITCECGCVMVDTQKLPVCADPKCQYRK